MFETVAALKLPTDRDNLLRIIENVDEKFNIARNRKVVATLNKIKIEALKLFEDEK